jgi:outer membrane protein assembly factor BamE (lipoprotein component of BamABCDE complex)
MKVHTTKVAFTIISICALGLASWLVFSVSFRAKPYRAVPFGGSYATYDRLADLLRLNMSLDEVRRILGQPQIEEDVMGGRRWTFLEDGPTAGGTCIVDFSPDNGTLRLAYFLNIQHVVFTNSLHREFGSPVDGGEFRNDPLLKMRWDQWFGKARSNRGTNTNSL